MKTALMILVLTLCTAACASAADAVKLPEPKKRGGPDLLTAIDQRGSAASGVFPKNDLTREDLATLLWAATGRNRDGAKWTVPMGMGLPPYTKIYVTDKTGAYLYDWKTHSLVAVGGAGAHAAIPTQAFGKTSPANLYMVTDSAALDGRVTEEWMALLAGAMSQNVYLAAQAVNVGARLIYSIDRDAAKRELRLAPNDKALFAIILGKN